MRALIYSCNDPCLDVAILAAATEGYKTFPQGFNSSLREVPLLMVTKVLHSSPIMAIAPAGLPVKQSRMASLMDVSRRTDYECNLRGSLLQITSCRTGSVNPAALFS